MQHKNILPLLGANVVVPQPYIVNPFLSNGNMIGYLNEFPYKVKKFLFLLFLEKEIYLNFLL